jgi:hypothetical protein
LDCATLISRAQKFQRLERIQSMNLHGTTMRGIQTAPNGMVLEARYAGGRLERSSDGRRRIAESFTWASRRGDGVNIFEEIAKEEPHPSPASGRPQL